MFGMCRVCLSCNVKIYLVEHSQFQELYKKLSCTELSTANETCVTICYICFSLLKKCHGFSKLAQKSYKRLQNLVEHGIVVTEEIIRNLNLGTNLNLSKTNLPPISIDVNSGDEYACVIVKEEFMETEERTLTNYEVGNAQISASKDVNKESTPFDNTILKDHLFQVLEIPKLANTLLPNIRNNIKKTIHDHEITKQRVETLHKQSNESLPPTTLVAFQSTTNTKKRKLNNGKIDMTLHNQPVTTNRKDLVKNLKTEPRQKRAVHACKKSEQKVKKIKIETNETRDSTIIEASQFTKNNVSSINLVTNKKRKIEGKLDSKTVDFRQLHNLTAATKLEIKDSKTANEKLKIGKVKIDEGKKDERKIDFSQLCNQTNTTEIEIKDSYNIKRKTCKVKIDDKINLSQQCGQTEVAKIEIKEAQPANDKSKIDKEIDICISEDQKKTMILETLQKLTDLIAEHKPSMFASYNMQCQKVREEKKIDATRRLPKKRFPWCNPSRALLAQLIKLAGSEQAGASLLGERVLPLFPKGFARMPTLLKMAGCKSTAARTPNIKQQSKDVDVSILLKLHAEKIPPAYVFKANSVKTSAEENGTVLLPYITNSFSLCTDSIEESSVE